MAVDSEKNIVTGKDIYIEDAKKDFLNNINFIGETTQKTEEPIDWKEAQGNNLYLTDISRTEIKDFNILGEITQEVIEEEEGITIEEESIYVDNVDTNKENSINIKGNTPTQEVIEAEEGTTVEGESVVVADGDIYKEVKAVINGNSYQETTEGYQLFNKDDEQLETNKGKYMLNGKVQGNQYYTYLLIDNVKPNTNYKYIGANSVGSNDNITVVLFDFYNGETYEKTSINQNKTTNTITTSENCTKMYVSIPYADKDTFMIYEGTEKKPYEPYTNGVATPNPNHKQEYELIDGVNILNPANLLLFSANKYIQTKTRIDVMPNTEYSIVSNKVLTDISINGYSDDTNYEKLTTTSIIKVNKRYYTFTTKANTKTLYFYIGQDTEYATLEEYLKSLEVMFIKGTEVSYYLPYGHIGLVQRGKNLYKLNKEVGFSTTINGITYTFKEKGKVNIKGTASATSEIFLLGYSWETTNALIKLKENKKYTASCNIATEGIQIIPLKLASTAIGYLKSTLQSVTFTGDNNGVSKILLRINSGVTVNEDIEFQIEEGSIATDYEPYIEPIVHSIDLAGKKLAKVNLEDNLIIGVNGSVNAKKITKEYILTGDETSLIENYVTKGLFQITLDNVSTDLTKVRAKSNYLKGTTGEIIRQTEDNYLVSTYDSNRIFFKINDFANDLQGFRAWLKEKYNAGKPMKVLYELAKTEVIDLPSIEPITLFEGTNVFELVTNLGTTMALTYNYVTPSPSINRPSEVNIVDGNYNIKIENKNKFDNTVERINAFPNLTVGSPISYTNSNFTYTFIKCAYLEKNKTYTISYKYDDYVNSNGRVGGLIDDDNIVMELISTWNFNKKEIQIIPKNSGWLVLAIDINTYDIQIEEGATATDYIEHQEQVYPLDTTEYPLYSENDYYYKSGDKWYVHNEFVRETIDGNSSQNIQYSGSFGALLYINIKIANVNNTSTGNIWSNKAKEVAQSQLLNNNGICVNNTANRILIKFDGSTNYNTNELARQFFLDNPYDVIYKLATPTDTEIINPILIEQLEALYNANLYETITNINSEGNTEVLPIIKLHYNFVTPAPSVNKKSEILGSKGNYNIKFENENFLDNSQVQFNITSGITTSFRDGKIHLNGTLDNIFQSAMVTSIDFKVNETGEYSFNVIGNIPTKYFTLRYADTNALIMDLISKDTINQTVLLEKNINYRIGIGVYSGFEYTIENTSFNLILVKGKNIPTTYIEHQEQVYPLSLSDIELNGKDNIRDTFIIELDNSYSFKKIKKLYLKSMFKKRDFAEEPLISTECSNAVIQGYYLTFNNIKRGTTLIYSTHQKHRKPNDYSTDTEWQKMNGNYISQLYPTTNIGLYVNIKFDTKEEFINWWNNLAPTLVYELDNPILTEIIDETLIQQIENLINNIEIYENTTYINLDGIGEIYIKYDGYDGMPSLKFPSELLSIKGEQTVTIRNANKFILLSYQNPGTIFEQNGIMFIMNNDGSINIFGYAEEDAEWYLVGGIDKEYEPIMTLNNNNILQLYDNKNTNVYIYLINNKNVIAMTNSKNSFTYNGEIDTIMIRVNKGTSIDTTIYPILTDENENTDNIKFEQQLYTIRFGNIELNGNNNVRDTFEIEFSQDDTGFKNINKLYHNKNFNKYIFTGDEDISLDSINNGIARFNIENIFINKVNNYLGIYCNYFRNENTNLENTIRSEIDNIVTTAVIFIDENIANTADSFKAYLKRLYDEGNPIETIYQLANPEKILIEDENLIQDMQNLLNATTYEGVNKIKSTATIVIEYTVKYKDNYDFYVDENNKFFYVPEYGIKFLFSPTESNIPEIAEASETSVKIAGKDGDEVLATTYEPLSFDLVCYTNENLDSKQKIAEISKVTRFLESIKYEPKNLALLDAERMIPVKYIKNLTTTRYPKSVKFSIPLKSSKSYTSILYPTKIFGNGEAYSSTIKETGCIITINGPAQIPIIYLNNYEIKYNNVILDGNKLIIDTGNSTVTHITSNGVKTNAAAYYNHEYPKIQYGMNKIEIKSGIGYDKQVITEWYDLKN